MSRRLYNASLYSAKILVKLVPYVSLVVNGEYGFYSYYLCFAFDQNDATCVYKTNYKIIRNVYIVHCTRVSVKIERKSIY